MAYNYNDFIISPREKKETLLETIGGVLLITAWFLSMVLLFSIL